MARRAVPFLGAVLLTAAIYIAVSMFIQSHRVLPEPFFSHPQSQGGDAGSALARPDDATTLPSGVHAWPSGASTPDARARPEAASPPPGARARPGGASTAVARARPDGTPATPGRRARPEGASFSPPPVVPARPGGNASTAVARDASPQPPGAYEGNGDAPQPRGKAKGVLEQHDHYHFHCHCHQCPGAAMPPPSPQTTASAAPPPPSPQTAAPAAMANHTVTINRSMLVIGSLYSLLSFCSPMITFWSTGMSVEATQAFHGWLDLTANALTSIGWLLFSISQLNGEDGKVIGTTGVVINAIGFTFYTAYIVCKLVVAGYMATRDCIWVLLSYFGSFVGIVLVAVYGPMQRESKASLIISAIACVLQIISQLIPLVTVWPLLQSMMYPQIAKRPEHVNSRKLIVFSRVGSFGLSLFWVSYCSMTYEHDNFQLANDVGCALSFVSMILHLVYTLRPHDLDYPAAP